LYLPTVTHIGELAALATACLWTLSALAWTTAGRSIGALQVNFLRMIIACGFMLAYGRIVRGLWLPSDAPLETWTLLGVSGFVGFFLADLCFFQSLLWLGPRITLLFQSLSPPFAALISYVFVGEPLPLRGWLAMMITVLGVVWVVLERGEHQPQRPHRHVMLGVALAVLAALGQAVGLVLSRKGMMGQYDAVAATFIRAAGAMIGFVALITILRAWPTMAAAARNRRAMLILTFGAFVGPFAGVALSMVAVSRCHPGVVATILSTMPVLILPFVVLLYREKVSLRAVAGAIISVAGVAILMLPGKPQTAQLDHVPPRASAPPVVMAAAHPAEPARSHP
jgi:drug/metabolite transporter (DMT)-like permease